MEQHLNRDDNKQPLALLDQLENGELDEQQRRLLEELRRCLAN